MSIQNPIVDEQSFQNSLTLQRRLNAVFVVGTACHCTRIADIPTQTSRFGKALFYTDGSGTERAIGRWRLSIFPEQDQIRMIRFSGVAGSGGFSEIIFNESDSDAVLATKAANAIDDIRLASGINASRGAAVDEITDTTVLANATYATPLSFAATNIDGVTADLSSIGGSATHAIGASFATNETFRGKTMTELAGIGTFAANDVAELLAVIESRLT